MTKAGITKETLLQYIAGLVTPLSEHGADWGKDEQVRDGWECSSYQIGLWSESCGIVDSTHLIANFR